MKTTETLQHRKMSIEQHEAILSKLKELDEFFIEQNGYSTDYCGEELQELEETISNLIDTMRRKLSKAKDNLLADYKRSM